MAEVDFPESDLLIVMGTSLAVQPFASLIDRPPHKCARLLINREVVGERKRGGMSSLLAMLMGGSSRGGFRFSSPGNQRDVKFIGDVEDGVKELVRLLGWEKELEELQAGEIGTL
uniref:Deacetylase sirtuin-type domain-containing protein n=1 Tax=Paramoeba aestuarina TaxID=180227 RepID=A0A7S4NGW2_9EUKA